MDIAGLPGPGFVPSVPPSSQRPAAGRERVVEPLVALETVPRPREPVERVVQGEVLQRERSPYASTQAFLHGRAYAADDGARSDSSQAQRALGAYLSHSRDFIQPDANRGRQVDYFA